MDTPPEAAFDRIVHLAVQVFQVPIALVSLVDHERQWCKACYGLDTRETHRDLSFCTHALLADEVLVVPDATRDPRFVANPLVTGAPGIRFYAGPPLRTHDGYPLGTLCILDTTPRAFGTAAQTMLADLAALVINELEFRRALTQAQHMEAALAQANDALEQRVAERTAAVESGQCPVATRTHHACADGGGAAGVRARLPHPV